MKLQKQKHKYTYSNKKCIHNYEGVEARKANPNQQQPSNSYQISAEGNHTQTKRKIRF